MSLAELLPSIHALPRGDKLRLMQVLVSELVREEGVAPPSPEGAAVHPVWSPYEAYDAAATLMKAREADESRRA